jgi:hypothetical protein
VRVTETNVAFAVLSASDSDRLKRRNRHHEAPM